METVSESFKNAIKSDTREIKGYVEVIYNEKDMTDYTVTSTFLLERISTYDNVLGSTKKIKKYASLEENYTLLDGSFILPNYNIIGDESGIVSEDIFENIENATLNITNTSKEFITCSGITIYFEDNIARNFDILITYEDDAITSYNIQRNTKSIYQEIFDEEISIKSLKIKINQIEYPNRRIRIASIDFGISQIYEGNDLVSFTVNEEIDLLLTSTPINDCKINLSNYENAFNPLNPTGLTKYLNDNCVIKPYIGILTEENGIEYVLTGHFYLKDWSNDANGNVTLNGQSLMGILSGLTLKSDGQFLYNNNQNWTGKTLGNYLSKMYGYIFQFKSYGTGHNLYLKDTNLLNYLKTHFAFMATADYPRKFFISRNNEAILDLINDIPVDTISRKQLIEDVKYESKTVINKVKITDIDRFSSKSSTTKEDVLNQTYTLTANEEYVWFTFNKRISGRLDDREIFSYTNNGNGQAELVDYNNWLAYIKFTGNVGDAITIHLVAFVFENPSVLNFLFQNNAKIGDTLSLDYTNYFNASNERLKSNAEFYLTRDKKYKVTGNYIGDPSLTTGDTITVETKFGNKDVILTKIGLKFDGGLSGNFEGMGD